jgi:hypothetical protein
MLENSGMLQLLCGVSGVLGLVTRGVVCLRIRSQNAKTTHEYSSSEQPESKMVHG